MDLRSGVLNTSRTSIPRVLRNVGRSGQESGDFVMSGNCEIETNCNTGGQYRNIFARRFPREAWPALEGTGSELHRATCIRNHFPKKKRSCYITRLASRRSLFTFVKSTLHFPLLCDIFRQRNYSIHIREWRITRSPSLFFDEAKTRRYDYIFLLSKQISFLGFYFLGLNRASSISSASVCGFWWPKRENGDKRSVKSRASTTRSHPLTQEISRVYDSSVERPPIEQILPSPYG